MLKTEIVKDIVLTTCMVAVAVSTITIGIKIETLRESSARQHVISSINAVSSASIQNKKKKTIPYAHVQSRHINSNSISLPVVSSPTSTIKPVSVTATPSVVVAQVPMGSGLSVSDMSRKNTAYGDASNTSVNNSLSSSTRMLAAASSSRTSSHSVTISEPFSDARPSSVVRTRSGLPDDPGEPVPDPEDTPLGDGIWSLLCCVLAYIGFIRRRTKRATK